MKRSRSKNLTITMRDVAEKCGVSPATVSIVLNNAPLARYVAAATKERIERAAKTLGYRPNAMARFLRSKRSHSVGVMFFDITDPFCTPIFRGIENSLYQASYLPIFADAHNQLNRFERYLEMLLERHIEALIVVANWLFVDIDLLADLGKQNIPTTTIGVELQSSNIGSVMVDNEAGAYLALEHLYLLGHRKIAFIRGPKRLIDSVPRWKGIQKFAHSAGLEIDTGLVVDLPDFFDPNSGFEGGYRLTEELLQGRRRFTALMAFDDMTAFGAIRALHTSGIRVPEQCSVIGFDNIAHSSVLTPALTTVAQPLAEMGKMAVNIVAERLKPELPGKAAAVHRKLVPRLVVRSSTCKATPQ